MNTVLRAFAALFATALLQAQAPPATGQPAPPFQVKDVQGKPLSLAALKGKVVVLEWTNPGCPFVVRHYEAGSMQALQQAARDQGAVWVSVSSTHAGHKDFLAESPLAAKYGGWKTGAAHLVNDAEGALGRLYGARTTPHLFVIDGKGTLVYQGGVDDDPRGTKADRVPHLGNALKALQAGKAPEVGTTAPYGCSVKFKP